mmetsp:Transcript_12757/g.19185  ORF Transcript_12757/g.19185 Transcript_12757/m.19185 type:complete len:207 (+) Transcript_12757:222-842(+)
METNENQTTKNRLTTIERNDIEKQIHEEEKRRREENRAAEGIEEIEQRKSPGEQEEQQKQQKMKEKVICKDCGIIHGHIEEDQEKKESTRRRSIKKELIDDEEKRNEPKTPPKEHQDFYEETQPLRAAYAHKLKYGGAASPLTPKTTNQNILKTAYPLRLRRGLTLEKVEIPTKRERDRELKRIRAAKRARERALKMKKRVSSTAT